MIQNLADYIGSQRHAYHKLCIVRELTRYPNGLLLEDLEALLGCRPLHRHLRELADQGMVAVWEASYGRWPEVFARLSPEGLEVLKQWRKSA